jgi:hypothetical protein
MSMFTRLAVLVALMLAGLAPSAGAEPGGASDGPAGDDCAAVPGWAETLSICVGSTDYYGDVCRAIGLLAWRYSLPQDYFARLIWQESRFDATAVSGAGAQGIAQFMPGTAQLRGLGDSFRPAQALASSAEYLRFLADRFGSLGLAAAAYNGGEGRIAQWLQSGGMLPAETRAYVEIVTGRTAEQWLDAPGDPIDYRLDAGKPFQQSCLDLAAGRQPPALDSSPSDWQPWGVLIAQNFSAAAARASFERAQSRFAKIIGGEKLLLLSVHNPNFGRGLRHSAMIGKKSQAEAAALCARLSAAGGSCVVVKN